MNEGNKGFFGLKEEWQMALLFAITFILSALVGACGFSQPIKAIQGVNRIVQVSDDLESFKNEENEFLRSHFCKADVEFLEKKDLENQKREQERNAQDETSAYAAWEHSANPLTDEQARRRMNENAFRLARVKAMEVKVNSTIFSSKREFAAILVTYKVPQVSFSDASVYAENHGMESNDLAKVEIIKSGKFEVRDDVLLWKFRHEGIGWCIYKNLEGGEEPEFFQTLGKMLHVK